MKILLAWSVGLACLLPLVAVGVRSTSRVSEVEICWQSSSNTSYQVRYSADLTSEGWNNLGPPVLADGSTSCLRDPARGSSKFYRVEEAERIWIRVSELEICWDSASNLIYQVQYRSEWNTNVWIDLEAPVTATGPRTCVTEPAGQPPRLFRVAGPDMVWVPPGTFMMGSPPTEPARSEAESPQSLVTISRGFWMGKYEVTQGEYLALMGSNPSRFQPPDATVNLNRPVEMVTWFDATNYCARVTEQEGVAERLPVGYVYRLPTEAEWEYACRAGTTTPFHYGNELRSAMANFDGHYEYPPCESDPYWCYNPSGIYLVRTAAVGSYGPNAWGLYDMHGNVWEWCLDWYAPYSGGSVTDPLGAATGSLRVFRGGTWSSLGLRCRSASRGRNYPEDRGSGLGFRVVLARPLP